MSLSCAAAPFTRRPVAVRLHSTPAPLLCTRLPALPCPALPCPALPCPALHAAITLFQVFSHILEGLNEGHGVPSVWSAIPTIITQILK